MTSCDFAEFYSACVEKLTDIQLRTLSPKAEYFRLKDGYCGLFIEEERVWISIFVGGIQDIWKFRRILMDAGVSTVGFKCRLGSPTYTLAKYYGAKIDDCGEKYPDGAPVMRCFIDKRQTRRVKKIGQESQPLT